MPRYNDAFLLWDGACPADPTNTAEQTRWWVNATAVGDGRDKPPVGIEERPAQASSQAKNTSSVGAVLSIQRASVVVVTTSALFAPAQEHCLIKLRIKDIDTVKQLVLQIRDVEGKLVYAERLEAKQVWALANDEGRAKQIPPTLAFTDHDSEQDKLTKRGRRAGLGWADPVNGPYRVCVLLSTDGVAIPLDCDPTPLPTEGAARVRHAVGEELSRIGLDETSVRLHSLAPIELLSYPAVYEALTFEPWPKAAPADPAKAVLWAKCWLNSLGLYAGPIDTKEDDPDFESALVRYRTIRGIGGHTNFEQETLEVEPTLPDSRPLRGWNGGETPQRAGERHAPRESTGVKAGLNVLRHLELEDPTLHHVVRREVCDAEPDDVLDKLGEPEQSFRVYVDASRYYVSSDEFGNNRKADVEREWLTRPVLPLRAGVRYERRDGQGDSQAGDGIEVPDIGARSSLRLLWRCEDELEDTRVLPSPETCAGAGFQDLFFYGAGADSNRDSYKAARRVYGDHRFASRAQAYIDRAKQALHEYGPSHRHNARALVGGLISGDDAVDARESFARLEPGRLDRAPGIDAAESFGRPANVCLTPELVYFRPSIIAGDRYHVVAEIYVDPAKIHLSQSAEEREALTEESDLARIDREREAIAKVLERFGRLNSHAYEHAIQKSAALTVWRRLRVAQIVDWPAQSKMWDGRDFDYDTVWNAVRAEYAFCFIELPPAAELERSTADAHSQLVGDHVALLKALADQARGGVDFGCPVEFPDPIEFLKDHVFPPFVKIPRLEVSDGSLPSVARIFQRLLVDAYNRVLAPWTGGPPAPPRTHGGGLTKQRSEDELKLRGVRVQCLMKFLELLSTRYSGDLSGDTARTDETLQSLIGAAARQLAADLHDVLARVSPSKENHFRTYQWKDAAGRAAAEPKDAVNPVVADWPRFRSDADTSCMVQMAAVPNLRTRQDEPLKPGEDPLELDTREYDARCFARLFDLLWMPPPVEAEIEAWAAGNSNNAHETWRVYQVLDQIFSSAKPDEYTGVDLHVFNASKHFYRWYKTILEPDVPQFRVDQSISRRIRLCPIDRVAQEKKAIQKALAGFIQYVFSRVAAGLDLEIRHNRINRPSDDGGYGELSDGLIIINAVMYPQVQVAGDDYQPFGGSMGCAMGLALLSQQTMLESYALWAHEIGHTLFMQHFRNAAGYLFDHDHADTNCAMSYPLLDVSMLADWQHLAEPGKDYERRVMDAEAITGFEAWPQVRECVAQKQLGVTKFATMHVDENALPQVMRSHFCGKCNLKLRGWDIHARKPAAPAPQVTAPSGGPPPPPSSGGPPPPPSSGGPPPPPSSGGPPPPPSSGGPPPPPSSGGPPPPPSSGGPPPPPSSGGPPPPPGSGGPPPPPGSGGPPPPSGGLPSARGGVARRRGPAAPPPPDLALPVSSDNPLPDEWPEPAWPERR